MTSPTIVIRSMWGDLRKRYLCNVVAMTEPARFQKPFHLQLIRFCIRASISWSMVKKKTSTVWPRKKG